MANNRPIKRLQKPKPVAPAPLSQQKDMYAPDWDSPGQKEKAIGDRAALQRVIPRGNPGIVRQP